MSREQLCRFLDWDSSFFKYRIARLSEARVDPRTLARAVRWCKQHGIDCLYVLTDLGDTCATRALETQRFHLVDMRVTLVRRLDAMPEGRGRHSSTHVRPARAQDLPVLRAIAGSLHTDSRFFQDGHFPKARCRELYRAWIEKSLGGEADIVLVPVVGKKPVGYSVCVIDRLGRGQITLFGIAKAVQGREFGRQLLGESLRWFAVRGASYVSVVTQGRNIGSQRLYQGYGFRTAAVQAWYHRWFVHSEVVREEGRV